MQNICCKAKAGWVRRGLLAIALAAQVVTASAATFYVWQSSPSPAPPFATWGTAATNIQDAINVATAGDEIVVTNGVYARGFGAGARVGLNKPVTVRSVNGPAVTIIRGDRSIPSGVGPDALRCAYVANGAVLSGFALTNGATIVFPSSAYGRGGGAYCEPEGVVSNCVLTANVASEAGGLFGGHAKSCRIEGNMAFYGFGGGAAQSTLSGCILSSNLVFGQDDSCEGGGAYDCTLDRCIISGNSSINDDENAAYGGGVARSRVVNCLVKDNKLFGRGTGGGAYASSLTNCTVVGNDTGAIGGVMVNCIAYDNLYANFADFGFIASTCTTPLPTTGTGNITNEPAFVDAAAGNYRLRPGSPCIDAGDSSPPAGGTDLDGRTRPLDGNGDGLAAFDMGAYESKMPLLVWQGSPNPVTPFQSWATAAHTIQDAIDDAEAGDEITVTNGVYATGESGGARVLIAYEPGDGTDPIVVHSVNGPAVTVIDGSQAMRCAVVPDGILSGFTLRNGRGPNGAGAIGGLLTNCIIINNHAVGDDPVGGGVDQAVLLNCQLMGNVSDDEAGGAANSVLVNCLVAGNQASVGGGVSVCTLYNSLVISNHGVGAIACALVNCTVVGNSGGGLSGGSDGCAATNCIVYHNAGANFGDSSPGRINFTCTFPLPTNGFGNIAADPRFVNPTGADFRLQAHSTCIDAGTNLFTNAAGDFAGLRPPLDGNRDGLAASDMGAYEFNSLFFTSITKVGNNTRLCWFDSLPGMQLQAAASLNNPVWTNVPFVVGTNCVELPNGSGSIFFRLVNP